MDVTTITLKDGAVIDGVDFREVGPIRFECATNNATVTNCVFQSTAALTILDAEVIE